MSWNSRLDVVEVLEGAGWTGAADNPIEKLRHTTGAAWAFLPRGGCGLICPNGAMIEFPWGGPDSVVIAACLAAADQLQPAPTVVCDAEGHAIPCTCTAPGEQPRPEPATTARKEPVRASRAAMAAYEVPTLSREEVERAARINPAPADCPQCQKGTPVSHWPSSTCQSAFVPGAFNTDRLCRVHCTCDRCF
ncbi:hypothetical protein [Streptomyces cinereoruber]|uniref:hypothetical protein n=1 Tax=Streptomyces cinereoruber TaxID=67260 RepID=UPI0036405E9C